MKKIVFLCSLGLFAFTLNANNENLEDGTDEAVSAANCLVSVTCAGSTEPDYVAKISCQYAEALAQQFLDSCE